MSVHDEISRVAKFADINANGDINKIKKRLSQDRQPNTRSSTEQWVNWSNMSDYLGQPFDATKIPLSKLEQMQRDPMLSFGLMFIKVPLIRAPWYIESTDAQRAAFVDKALRRIYGRLILSYSNCFSFGYSAIVKRFEYFQPDWTYIEKNDEAGTEKMVWDDPEVPALVWKPFISLNPRNVSPHWNAKGEFAGIDLTPAAGYGAFGSAGYPFDAFAGNSSSARAADIPLDWALWATNEKDSVYGSLWGYPRLGYAYRYWWSYWYKFGLADRAFEKWADPPVFVYHPSEDAYDTDENLVDYSAEALALAEKIRSGANASLPSDVHESLNQDRLSNTKKWSIEQLKSEANFAALDSTFKYLDVLKLRSMMVPEQSLVEGQGGSSSRNVAEKFGDIFQESQAVVMEEIDDLINRYVIPQLLEANFGSGGASCTKITTGFNRQDVDAMRSIIESFANKDTPMPIDLRETLEYLGVPTVSPELFAKELEKKAKEQELLNAPAPIPAKNGNAGVSNAGLYYNDRERITLSVSPEELKSYLGGLLSKEEGENNEENAKMVKTLLSEIEKLDDKVENLATQEPPVVNVEVTVPEKPESKPKKVRKTIVRDENGDAKYIDEEEVEDEQA